MKSVHIEKQYLWLRTEQMPDASGTSPRARRGARLIRVARGGATLLSALLVLTLLGCGSSSSQGAAPTPRPHLTPTPTLDPESQAYITLLRSYYIPMVNAFPAGRACFDQVSNSKTVSDMLTCRAPFGAELAAAQTLRTQLATARPPVRWQTQHAALRQAVDAWIATQTEQMAAIDAQDVARFLNANIGSLSAFCPIISQLNAGPPPLSPSIPELEPYFC